MTMPSKQKTGHKAKISLLFSLISCSLLLRLKIEICIVLPWVAVLSSVSFQLTVTSLLVNTYLHGPWGLGKIFRKGGRSTCAFYLYLGACQVGLLWLIDSRYKEKVTCTLSTTSYAFRKLRLCPCCSSSRSCSKQFTALLLLQLNNTTLLSRHTSCYSSIHQCKTHVHWLLGCHFLQVLWE